MQSLVATLPAICVVVVVVANVAAAFVGRRGTSTRHAVAFVAGLTGLAFLPLFLLSAALLLLSSMPPLGNTPTFFFWLSGGVTVFATALALTQAVRLWSGRGPGPNNSSKPTPLRGAA